MGSLDASIVIPVKNGMEFLAECLESCFSQETDYDFEIILVDDNSTDGTLAIAKTFEDDKRAPFKILNSPGSGISDALNFGIMASSATYIIRIDSDDKMQKTRVQEQINAANQNSNLVLLGSQIGLFGGNSIGKFPNHYPLTDSELRIALSEGCFFAHPAVLIRREALVHVNYYNPKLDGAEDYELWLLLASQGEIQNLESVLTQYRVHSGQFTSKYRTKSLMATAKVRVNFIFGRGRFNNRKKVLRSKISRFLMFRFLILEFFYFIVSKIRSRD